MFQINNFLFHIYLLGQRRLYDHLCISFGSLYLFLWYKQTMRTHLLKFTNWHGTYDISLLYKQFFCVIILIYTLNMECITAAYKIHSLQANHFVRSLPWVLVITHMVKEFLTLQNQTNVPCPELVLYSLQLNILYSWFPYIQQSVTRTHTDVLPV